MKPSPQSRKAKPWVVNSLLILASLLLCLLTVEAVFRIPAWFHTPEVAEKQKEFIESFSYPYSYGIVRPYVRMELRDYFPTGQQIDYPVRLETNSFGMRMREIDRQKDPNTVRIAVMGDSSTFGWMVPEEKCYARLLETALNERCEGNFEVLNFGVPGYTSFHGLQQYDRLVKHFQPDWLILAYGFNDSYESRFPEKEFYSLLKERNLVKGLHGIPLWLFDHSSFGHWLVQRLYGPASAEIERMAIERAKKDEWYPRVSKRDYRANLIQMIEDAQSYGSRVLLLHLNIPNSWVQQPLTEIAQSKDLPLLDVRKFFFENVLGVEESERWESSSQGLPSVNGHRRAWFRVQVPPEVNIPDTIYIVGNDPALGDGKPNQIAMFDDGTHGDRKVNDRIWTIELNLSGKKTIDYSFTNSGPAGKWVDDEPVFENTFKAIRYYHRLDPSLLKSNQTAISPLHTLDEIPIQPLLLPGDPIHPNLDGHALIAEMLFEELCGKIELIK